MNGCTMSESPPTIKVSQETFEEITRALSFGNGDGEILHLADITIVSRGAATLTPDKEVGAVDLVERFVTFDASSYTHDREMARDFTALKSEARAFLSGLRTKVGA